MLITDISVKLHVDADARNVFRVTFCGEGGDCVTVDIADTGQFSSEDTEPLIEYAKVLLIQTATFSTAENEYDARSNGDFDKVQVTDVVDPSGRAYHFEAYRDGRPIGVPSSFHADEMEAGAEALRLAVDLLVTHPDGEGTASRVTDASGRTVREVSFSEAREEQSKLSALSGHVN